jgi:hypothetical protein
MTSPPMIRFAVIAAALLLPQAGCLSFCHPVEPPPRELTASCEQVPRQCRQRVYVFFVHGVDPLDFANLSGVRDYVQSLGFIKTYYGQLYDEGYFTHEIRRIHQREPEARFALVGFSFGANEVRDIANAVRQDNIPIDLLVYLGGNTLTNAEEDRPPNVSRIVNILAVGWVWNGSNIDNAQNVTYDNVWHFGSPTHPYTLETLAHELAEVAAHVPYVEERAAPPEPITLPAEWDFLMPGGN